MSTTRPTVNSELRDDQGTLFGVVIAVHANGLFDLATTYGGTRYSVRPLSTDRFTPRGNVPLPKR